MFLDANSKTTRVLEDDNVTVYGQFDGTITYKSTTGVSITIPSCYANRIDVEGYTASTAQTDESGAYTVTKSNYDSFARDESTYANATITFNATVIQVMEGDDYTQYRMAIDGDNGCVFLTQIDGLPETGVADGATLSVLYSDAAIANPKPY